MRLAWAGFLALFVSFALGAGAIGPPGASAAPSGIRAGVGVVDATWHVGASAGQYATDRHGIADGDPRSGGTGRR